jgi:nucleotide-binding universal stress UspA family protein
MSGSPDVPAALPGRGGGSERNEALAYNVVIPLDGSRLAERSLAFVPSLSRLDGLNVTLVSVVNPAEDVHMLSQAEASDREANVLRTYLHEVAGDMQKHHNIQVATEVLRGNPADAILERLRTGAADLLVVSTHGRSGLSRWRIGSVADKLIRGAACETLVVGPRAGDTEGWLEMGAVPPFKKILVPVDGSELAEQAVASAQRFAKAFESEVHVVRVINVVSYGDGLMMESAYTPQLIDSLQEAADEYVAGIAGRISAPGGVRTKVLVGSPAITLEQYVEVASIDLVVMTTHGRGGIARLALGSVTDRMLGGEAPVLVVRPK